MSQLPNYVLTDRGTTKTCSTGSAWEPKLGYSRAVRKGHTICVTGTVGIVLLIILITAISGLISSE